ncbi:MAG: hypothetical protein QXQ16_02390 [Candidatus Aenigmatarchaeota archaeon]
MHKKSISPLIATFILITLTVAIGAMIVAWGRQYVQKQIMCAGMGASLTVISKDFPDNDSWSITLNLFNTGEYPIKDKEIYFKLYSLEGITETCGTGGGCYIDDLNNLNELSPGNITSVGISINDTSIIYGKNINKLELYHAPCDLLLATAYI